jgi:TolB-like protein
VLAFDNLSNDAELQFFCDGISEEIIQRLARGANLRVIGRTSSFQFRGERKAEAAQRLNCSHVLDGSVRRASAHVRISARLMEVASGTTLWSDRYDRAHEGVFEVHEDRESAGLRCNVRDQTAYSRHSPATLPGRDCQFAPAPGSRRRSRAGPNDRFLDLRRHESTPMHRSQLCVVSCRRTAADEAGRGPCESDAVSIYT